MLLNLQPMTSQAQRPASCRVEGCSAPHRARGLCGTHYQADRRGRGLVQAEDSRRPCSPQPPGQRVEDKLQWAREILALYGGTPSDPSH